MSALDLPPMTLTEARRIAARNRRNGYFRATPTGRDYWLTCPLCSDRLPFTPADGGYDVATADVDRTVVAHLTDPDPDVRCRRVPQLSASVLRSQGRTPHQNRSTRA